eukprot:Pompholyxophrys_punicea_v1_NODE_58_length_4147_cov_5.424487.p4 type:complete len:114 gc:universal NODE_58_length_4147_cov_5.424487:799-1140(+)
MGTALGRSLFSAVRLNKGGAYELLDATGALLARAVPPSHLKVIAGDMLSDSQEVTAIVDHRKEASDTLYRVRWKGLSEADDTWEKPSAFDDPTLISRYWRRRTPSRYTPPPMV